MTTRATDYHLLELFRECADGPACQRIAELAMIGLKTLSHTQSRISNAAVVRSQLKEARKAKVLKVADELMNRRTKPYHSYSELSKAILMTGFNEGGQRTVIEYLKEENYPVLNK